MKITREALKNIVKETMIEENEYKVFFKKALEKAGKSIPQMSDDEKKAFFNKIEKTWKGRGTKSEGNAFGAAVAKAKKDGDDDFKVGDKEYKVESINELSDKDIKKAEQIKKYMPGIVGMKFANKASNEDILAYADLHDKSAEIYNSKIKPIKDAQKKLYRKYKLTLKESINEESINEGPSTEEKRIAMLAVRKQAKYRNVSLEQAIQDQINALEELKRDAKRGKLK